MTKRAWYLLLVLLTASAAWAFTPQPIIDRQPATNVTGVIYGWCTVCPTPGFYSGTVDANGNLITSASSSSTISGPSSITNFPTAQNTPPGGYSSQTLQAPGATVAAARQTDTQTPPRVIIVLTATPTPTITPTGTLTPIAPTVTPTFFNSNAGTIDVYSWGPTVINFPTAKGYVNKASWFFRTYSAGATIQNYNMFYAGSDPSPYININSIQNNALFPFTGSQSVQFGGMDDMTSLGVSIVYSQPAITWTPSLTNTPVSTRTPTITPTPTFTINVTATVTFTNTPTATATPTGTLTPVYSIHWSYEQYPQLIGQTGIIQ